MKTSVFAAAATMASVVSATKKYYGGTSSVDCPYVPNSQDFLLFADNIQTVSQVNPDQAFLRSPDLYVYTPGDLGTASSFSVPDFALGHNCILNLAVPTVNQIHGDLSQVAFSGDGNLNFTQITSDFPSSGLTYNTLGPLKELGVFQVVPGQLLHLATFPCPAGGTQLPGIITSIDTSLFEKNAFGPNCLSGLFYVIEGVGNVPVSPPRAPATTTSAS